MKIAPVISEKTMNLAKVGKYTFRVGRLFNKYQIKEAVQKYFDVHVTSVKTIKEHKEIKRTAKGKYRTVQPTKKAIVTLKDKEKIDLFEESKK